MTKKKGGNHQVFSLRRYLLQRTRFNDSTQNSRANDIESGISRNDNPDKLQSNAQFFANNASVCSTTPSNSNPNAQIDETDFCVICYLKENSTNLFYKLDLCGHRFCIACLVKYLKNEINESRTDIACPQCSSAIHPNDIGHLLKDFPLVINKYEDFMIRRYLVSDPDSRWCPAPDCGYAVIATGCASCPQIQCERPNCGVSFCYHCKAEWHPDQTCDAARTARQKILRASSVSYSQDLTRRDEIKPCPRCQVLIVKMNDGSCNHMVCSVCGAEFCWLCMKEVSDLHYLSPSGCTFWGKKPWSRKKKIVWQIGTLIGAPVGIALLAGIAVPSMVIGIPVWVGRKLYDRYRNATKRKRNISVTIGVTASILISPLLAGLAIAIGVPILLFYVYGVVPISLCRAGCGASSSEEYRFDMTTAEENRTQYNSDGISMDAVSRIGETSIGDVSLSATSGSALGVLNSSEIFNTQLSSHRESTVALAGSVNNQKMGCSDNFSAGGTSVLTLNSEKSMEPTERTSVV